MLILAVLCSIAVGWLSGGRLSRSPLVIIRSDDKTSGIILDCKLSRAH